MESMSALEGILRQRCPRCRHGAIYRRFTVRGWLALNETCPVCRLKFDRSEQGYFIGAMYVSYGLSIPPVLALVLTFWRLAHWSMGAAIAGGAIAYLPLVPLVVRLSRVIWIYIDRSFDPS
jgi:uncharacterized protein (DUF983 family)